MLLRQLSTALAFVALTGGVAVGQNATTTTTSDTQQTAAIKAAPLAWAPPELDNPTTIVISEKNRDLRLDVAKDYILKMPDAPLTVKGGLVISGGHNVVLIGGAIFAPCKEDAPQSLERRALYLKGQSGTIHIEGLHIGGEDLAEALNIDQRAGGILQLQNWRIERVHGDFAGHHADLVQTWAGPAELRIDRLTGSTDYQGFFLLPNQHFQDGAAPKSFDFRHMNIIGSEHSAYLLWTQTKPEFPIHVSEVWLQPNPRKADNRDAFLWPKPSTSDQSWKDVKVGAPPDGDFVPEGVAGVKYISPGYEKLP